MDADAHQALPPSPPQYADGSRVLGMDGLPIGEVVASYREYLIVERGYFFPTNYFIPFSAVAEAGGGDVVLRMSRIEALTQGWERPPADPIAPPAPALPVPPPDPTFPGAAGPESSRRPAGPEAASSHEPQPAVAAAPVAETVPEPAPAGSDLVPTGDGAVAGELVEAGSSVETEQDAMEVPVTVAATGTSVPTEEVSGTADLSHQTTVASDQPGSSDDPDGQAEPEPIYLVRASGEPMPDEQQDEGALEPDAGAETLTADAPPAPGAASVGSGYPSPAVGVPGRRLTDSELWSLLEPKEGLTTETTAEGVNGDDEEDADTDAPPPPPPGGSGTSGNQSR